MRLNQKFFGQEHFEIGTVERAFSKNLGILKPVMSQYEFSIRDRLPSLPADSGGLVQVKYNGMLSIVLWDVKRNGFVVWNPRGRCYFSLDDSRKHPVTEYFNHFLNDRKDLAFIGETHVVRNIEGKNYMTEFNKSMSIIKNPSSFDDVKRIRLAVFDYVKKTESDKFEPTEKEYIDRFKALEHDFNFTLGCDRGIVHIPDYLETHGSFQDFHSKIQAFWNKFIGERGFEGLVMHPSKGGIYKIKFRDTLDAAIIAFRKMGNGRPVCENCGVRFDIFWLRKLSREEIVTRSQWFDLEGRLTNSKNNVWSNDVDLCLLCGGHVSNTAGPILGAKIALMTPDGNFLDIADGVQFSHLSEILDLIEPLYESEDYLWVKPEIIVEVSYQQLYLDSLRPVYKYENRKYAQIGTMKAISLRPYKPRLREDKTVNTRDLRLE